MEKNQGGLLTCMHRKVFLFRYRFTSNVFREEFETVRNDEIVHSANLANKNTVGDEM